MMPAISSLGSNLTEDSLSNKINNIKFKNTKNKDFYLCILDFSSKESCITISPIKVVKNENDKNIAEKYHWVGNLTGNIPQWHVTSDNLLYALNSLYFLYKKTEIKTLKDKIYNIVKLYYDDNPVIHIKKSKIIDQPSGKVYFFLPNNNEAHVKSKEFNKNYINKFLEDTKDNEYITRAVLYTIFVDGECIAEDKDYIKMLDSREIKEDEYYDGICSLCGSIGKVTANTKELKFKYYNTDKSSFASNMNGSYFKKNLSLCSNCYNNIISGEDYIFKRSASFAGMNLLMIPESLPFKDGDDLYIENIFNVNRDIILKNNEIAHIEDKLDGFYTIDLMFYRKHNNSFKILEFIPEIPESRMIKISKYMYKTSLKFKNVFDNFNYLTINGFYLSIKNTRNSNFNESLRMLSSLFNSKPIDRNYLIRIYLDRIRTDYYNNNINNITMYILQKYAYIEFLEKIDLTKENKKITGDNDMDSEIGNKTLDSGLNFIKNMNLPEESEGLFCIGYAIRYIGMILFKKKINNNPLLEKINYQGMNFRAVEKLMNQIDEKVKQYDIYGEEIAYVLYKAHFVLSKYTLVSSKWPINDAENVFLIMTGYSIENQFIFGKNKKTDNGDE